MAASALRMPFAAVHGDLARDVFVVWRALHEGIWPHSGPVLAGTIHLGPLWYWLLACLLSLGGGWMGALALLGFLAGSQFPLAYLAGKELHSRRAGMVWTFALLIPNWSSFEWVFPLHYLLSSALVIAFILCAARFWRTLRLKYLVAVALTFGLAVHAHPVNIALIWIAGPLVCWALCYRHVRWRVALLVAFFAMLPFLPYLVWDATQHFADLRAGFGYLTGSSGTGPAGRAWRLLYAIAIGGTVYWLTAVVHLARAWTDAVAAVLGITGILGLAGFLVSARAAPHALFGILATFAILLTVACIRAVTPFYMTDVLYVSFTGIVAVGLASFRDEPWSRFLRGLALLLVAGCFLVSVAINAWRMARGEWPFGFFPLFNVTAAAEQPKPLSLMPAYGMSGSGAFLCAQTAATAHGALAQLLLHDYAIDMRLACARADVEIGGGGERRQHWLGLSRTMLAELRLSPLQTFGSIGVIAAHARSGGHDVRPPSIPEYPAYMPAFTAQQEVRFSIRPDGDRYVAVSNVAFGFAPDFDISVQACGRSMRAVAADDVVHVYAMPDCGSSSRTDLIVTSNHPRDIDIATFR